MNTNQVVNQSSELANRAIKNLNNPKIATAVEIRIAVMYACTEFADLVPQSVIDEAVARIKNAIRIAKKATTC